MINSLSPLPLIIVRSYPTCFEETLSYAVSYMIWYMFGSQTKFLVIFWLFLDVAHIMRTVLRIIHILPIIVGSVLHYFLVVVSILWIIGCPTLVIGRCSFHFNRREGFPILFGSLLEFSLDVVLLLRPQMNFQQANTFKLFCRIVRLRFHSAFV